MPAEPQRFADLFNTPSGEAIYALTPREFERFVAYVLRRAGYGVKEVGPHWLRGVDLEMRLPGKTRIVGGVECKRFAPDKLVTSRIVKDVRGATAVDKPGAKPFVITTSDFNAAAHQLAEEGARRVYLLNGSQPVRYIRYIQGSRYDDDDTITALSPEFFAGRDGTPSHAVGNAKVLTIANNKGGVGKTTTAYYLGAELARQGKRVLLIDLDGQANLTERCFPEQAADHSDGTEHFPNIAQYFSRQRALHDLIISAGKERLSLIPSDPYLTLRDLGGSGRPDVELRFARDVQKVGMQPLATLGGTPDWIIIDTPPAMSVFTRAGLAAAQYVLAPVRPRTASVTGTTNMLTTLRTISALMGGNGATFMGAVITHWDGLKLSQNFADQVLPLRLQDFGGGAFETKIPLDNQLELLGPGAKIRGAEAYEALAVEVLRYVQPKPDSQDQVGATTFRHVRRGEG